jgi:hydroxymethylbilane synthase
VTARVRIGTRRSALALAQAREVAARLATLGVEADLVPMTTFGDRGPLAHASPAGLKGLFVAEIVDALQRGEVDLAVHSAKDLPSEDPEGVVVGAVPERAAPYDVMVTRSGVLAPGGVVATSSLRRRAQILHTRPDVAVRDLRGNVDTRLAKLAGGEADALILAAAGLARLGVQPAHATPIPLEEMVPAPGQGALAVQVRADDRPTVDLVARIDHARSRQAFEAEREVMRLLGGGCALPLGAYAERRSEGVGLIAVVATPDGQDVVHAQVEAGTPIDAAREAVGILSEQGAAEILAVAREGIAR